MIEGEEAAPLRGTAAGYPTSKPPDLKELGSNAAGSAKEGARHVAELAGIEFRLAALSGLMMLALAIAIAGVLIVAWVFIASVIAYVLVLVGLPWPAAGLITAALHLLAAFMLWRSMVRLSRNLAMPMLRRALFGANAYET